MTRKARPPKPAPPETAAPAGTAAELSTSDAAPAFPRLSRLEIRNLATITQLDLDLGGGFCAFTGETGAGKSIIVDALGLLLGGRANHDLIRSGEKELLVTGFWGDGDETEADSASRRLSSAGRGAARLSGEVVSVRELQEWAQGRLTIHWQHSAVSLLSPANQRGLLDRRVPGEAQAYAAAHAAWRGAVGRLERLQASQRERARQIDLLAFQVQEISEVSPDPGEEEGLNTELSRLSNLHTTQQAAAGGVELLSDGDLNAAGLLGEAVRALNAGAKYDETVRQLQSDLRSALESVQAIAGELRDVAEGSAADPEALDRVEARLSALSKLKNKYGPTLEDVVEFGARAAEELAALEADERDAGSLQADVDALHAELLRVGKALDTAREREAGPLAKSLLAVIRELGMPHARMEFALSPLAEPAASGLSDVLLRFSANPGEELGPLSDVASGGELSRVMLAVSTVLGADTPSVVFDEVDAGIGGAAATKVAEQLSRLAGARQVLVVTHLAQIAARAHHHYKVEKRVEEGRTVSRVRLLTGDERLEEIARMLSGNTSEAALKHARELLEG
ncbi:DNA repair protein RecN [Deinococcus wulumuqiensis]|uniref:DNA repair protein RecN n=1 Tax=Deinococcus wulumuqiensis TaxID=980427 RepID=A0AAV4K0R0_9DEIO|nr:DNA repair protein RecN [Deinococcus wulumuqiensis]QII19932.1 DNA repair protein RecN [Deinococcus wulumuqiensis R12]GGI74379.1 DNA repair protein RecN [Deinococcus wulumuqiensis]GGP29122.1 DNA repair protein RecN [Deinococcus wulumuqiensis]